MAKMNKLEEFKNRLDKRLSDEITRKLDEGNKAYLIGLWQARVILSEVYNNWVVGGLGNEE